MNNSIDFENQILDAIETITTKAIEDAGYDKTIKGIIIENSDTAIGKYRVKYQDSEIEAYSNNIDVLYPEGSMVNILVPNGDFSQTKTIIDIVEKEKIIYTSVLEEEDKYNKDSNNTINNTSEEFGVCSYKSHDIKLLYGYDTEEQLINLINLDPEIFKNNIQENGSFLLAGKIKTTLDSDQQGHGNFGIGIKLSFENSLGNNYEKEYQININDMQGSPYSQLNYTRQYKIFNIDKDDFKEIQSIYIFAEDFANTANDKPNDIFVKDLELYPTSRIPDDQLNQYNLKFVKSGKGYFTNDEYEDQEITITATALYKNQTAVKNAEYYWFKENSKMTNGRTGCTTYGGEGWECINNFIPYGVNNNLRKYISSTKITINKNDVTTQELKLKCVVVKNENILIEKEISIKNYDAQFDVIITSDDGTKFYFDYGSPTLTCEVISNNEGIEIPENLIYYWGVTDSDGVYKELIGTEGSQIVDGNIIHNIDLTQIKGNSIFQCSVFIQEQEEELYLGTATIELNNYQEINEDDFTLNILNGNKTYKYDIMGTSPLVAKNFLDKVQQVEPLTFEILDRNGNAIGESSLRECSIEWIKPEEPNPGLFEWLDSEDKLILNYTIAKKYDIVKASRNKISLKVKWNGLVKEASTYFNFMKEGEPGTNGTDIFCKIVPNIENWEEFNEYPMILNGELNYTPQQTNKWFNVILYKDGVQQWMGNTSDSGNNIYVSWSILKNKYETGSSTTKKDVSSISIDSSGNFSYNGYIDYNNQNPYSSPANIVKVIVTYQGKKYFSTLPLITAVAPTGMNFKLIKNSGFRYVVYDSDGVNPQYDKEIPFKIEYKPIVPIRAYGEHGIWSARGYCYGDSNGKKYLIGDESTWTWEQTFRPIDVFNGECITTALEFKVISNVDSSVVAKMHIPIHFYLYRYGIAALNDWDGNKITLNDEEGAILAPQVGAGSKNVQGQFTGMLMGEVKEAGRSDSDTGLFGYHQGQRSIFLNSKNGSALFGKNNTGRITIDPTTNTAMLYSQNYWKEYNTSGDNVGLPVSYADSNKNGAGMLIDLTTPSISFGSGNFSVNSSGHLTAKGGGSIAGWSISNNALSKGKVGISSNNGADTNIAFWAGNATASSAPFKVTFGGAVTASNITITGGSLNINDAFKVSSTGVLTATGADISGTITATLGEIGGLTIESDKVYLSSDPNHTDKPGCGFGSKQTEWAFWAGETDGSNGAANSNALFKVGHNGGLVASGANINGTINSINGYIAGFTINDGYLNAGSGYNEIGMSTRNGIDYAFWAGGNSLTAPFRVGHGGTLYAGNGHFSVESNGDFTLRTDGGGSMSMGVTSTHLEVSGLNVGSNGLNMQGHGISGISTLMTNTNEEGKTTNIWLKAANTSYNYHNLKFVCGILVNIANY